MAIKSASSTSFAYYLLHLSKSLHLSGIKSHLGRANVKNSHNVLQKNVAKDVRPLLARRDGNGTVSRHRINQVLEDHVRRIDPEFKTRNDDGKARWHSIARGKI